MVLGKEVSLISAALGCLAPLLYIESPLPTSKSELIWIRGRLHA